MCGQREKGGICDFSCKPCRGRFGFEFSPKEPLQLDIAAACGKLRGCGTQVEMENAYLAKLVFMGAKITLFRSGKVLVKEAGEEERAREIAEGLLGNITPQCP